MVEKKKNMEVKCHLCKNLYTYNGIGKHYKSKHNLSLKDNSLEFVNYLEFNYNGITKKLIDKINKGENILDLEGVGSGNKDKIKKIIKLIFSEQITITNKEFKNIIVNKRKKTNLKIYGNEFGHEKFIKQQGNWKDKEKAIKASLKAKTPEFIKRLKLRMAENNPSINNIVVEKRKITRSNWSEERLKEYKLKLSKSISSKECQEKKRNTLLKKYGGLIPKRSNNGSKIGHSKWHNKVKEVLKTNNIHTKSEFLVDKFIVDEIFEDKKIILELYGDFWHCNPKKFHEDYYHPYIKMTAKEIWEKNRIREDILTSLGYKLFIIWESDNLIEKILELKKML